jgi:hypothetical protein
MQTVNMTALNPGSVQWCKKLFLQGIRHDGNYSDCRYQA